MTWKEPSSTLSVFLSLTGGIFVTSTKEYDESSYLIGFEGIE